MATSRPGSAAGDPTQLGPDGQSPEEGGRAGGRPDGRLCRQVVSGLRQRVLKLEQQCKDRDSIIRCGRPPPHNVNLAMLRLVPPRPLRQHVLPLPHFSLPAGSKGRAFPSWVWVHLRKSQVLFSGAPKVSGFKGGLLLAEGSVRKSVPSPWEAACGCENVSGNTGTEC